MAPRTETGGRASFPAMPPTLHQQSLLAALAAKLDTCRRGEVGPLVSEAANTLGVAVQTAHAWLRPHRHPQRKQRADAGTSSVGRDEALLVAATLMHGGRLNGKQNAALSDVAEVLREGGMARLERTHAETGEIVPVSNTTVARALKSYGLHLNQIRLPSPHQPLKSLHPNEVWQVDASVCLVFYLPDNRVGMCTLKDAEHYKNLSLIHI